MRITFLKKPPSSLPILVEAMPMDEITTGVKELNQTIDELKKERDLAFNGLCKSSYLLVGVCLGGVIFTGLINRYSGFQGERRMRNHISKTYDLNGDGLSETEFQRAECDAKKIETILPEQGQIFRTILESLKK